MSLPILPNELKREIIKYIPQKDWYLTLDIDFLSNGLNDRKLWQIINLDDFLEISRDIKELLEKFGSKIFNLQWHVVEWPQSINLDAIAAKWLNLYDLNLAGNSSLASISFIRSLHSLQCLNLEGCINIKRVPLVNTLCSLRNIRNLNLSECAQIKKKDILRIATRLKNLTLLNVCDTLDLDYLTDNSVEDCLQSASEFLFCASIGYQTLDEWEEIHLKYPKLQICPASLEFLLEHRPFLD